MNFYLPSLTEKAQRAGAAVILFLVAIAAIAARRPDQVMFPEVWNEDGLVVIPQLIERGFIGVFDPLNGYLIIPARLISWIALAISFENYPAVSTYLGIAAQACCVVVVFLSPTKLRAPLACAIAMLALPMNAEVYALPQYTFWWSTTFLFLALLWRPAEAPLWRAVLLIIGSFSSPMGIVLLPLFLLRLAFTRRKEDLVSFLLLAVASAIQLYFVFLGDPAARQPFALSDIMVAVKLFFSAWTVFAAPSGSARIGLDVCLFLSCGLFVVKKEDRPFYFVLGLTLGAAIASSMLRVPIAITSPVGDGPRYYFLPLILMSWMLIWLAASRKIPFVAGSVILIAAALPTTVANFERRQEHLRPWAEAVRECREKGSEMPVHHDGSEATHNRPFYSASLCRQT